MIPNAEYGNYEQVWFIKNFKSITFCTQKLFIPFHFWWTQSEIAQKAVGCILWIVRKVFADFKLTFENNGVFGFCLFVYVLAQSPEEDNIIFCE